MNRQKCFFFSKNKIYVLDKKLEYSTNCIISFALPIIKNIYNTEYNEITKKWMNSKNKIDQNYYTNHIATIKNIFNKLNNLKNDGAEYRCNLVKKLASKNDIIENYNMLVKNLPKLNNLFKVKTCKLDS